MGSADERLGIAVDVRADLNPNRQGGVIATASALCPGCGRTCSRTVSVVEASGNVAHAEREAIVQSRRPIEGVVLEGCPLCQLRASGWSFREPDRLALTG